MSQSCSVGMGVLSLMHAVTCFDRHPALLGQLGYATWSIVCIDCNVIKGPGDHALAVDSPHRPAPATASAPVATARAIALRPSRASLVCCCCSGHMSLTRHGRITLFVECLEQLRLLQCNVRHRHSLSDTSM